MDISSLSTSNPYTASVAAAFYQPLATTNQSLANLTQSSASYQTQISDYGQVQAALSTLQTSAKTLSGPDAFSPRVASSSTPGIVTASADPGSANGAYNVQVSQIAQGETLVSAAQSSSTASIGSGSATTVTFNFANGATRNISIGSYNNSLSGIASTINSAGIGISASTSQSGAGSQLALTGPTGASNAFTITVVGDSAISNLLSHPPLAPNTGMVQTVAAQDSQSSVNGSQVTSSGNSVAHSGHGITLNLNAQGSATVTVSPDAARITNTVQSFVDAYNQVQTTIDKFRSTDLAGDNTLVTVKNQLAAAINTQGQSGSLGQIGITINGNGTLSLDSRVFISALSSNPASVAAVFGNSGNGVADRVASQVQSFNQPGGAVDATVSSLKSQLQFTKQLQSSALSNASAMQQSLSLQFGQLSTMLRNANASDQFLMSQLYQSTQLQGIAPAQSLQLGNLTPYPQVMYI